MKTPFIAVAKDQLGKLLRPRHRCTCGQEHDVEDANGKLQFVKCGEKSLLIGIDGREIIRWSAG